MSIYDKASLVQIPSGVKSGKLYSAKPSNGVGDFDFTRASTATRVNKDGLIETVATGTPRLDYPFIDGVVQDNPSLLLEPSRTNLLTYSEDFSNAYWNKSASTITSNIITSPDGTLNASLFESTGAAGYIYPISGLLSSAGNGTFTYSIYAKEGNTSSFTILISGVSNYTGNFNLTSVEASTSTANTIVDIFNAGNGWYRCSVTASLVASSAYSELQIGRISLGSNLYFYGAQLEEGSYPTSYIPTSGSTVTRVAEACNGAGDASMFNDSEGVLMAEISTNSDDTDKTISLNNNTFGSLNNRLWMGYSTSAKRVYALGYVNNSLQFVLSKLMTDETAFVKIACKYALNDVAFFVNGEKVATNTSALAFTELNSFDFNLGTVNVLSGAFYGNVKDVKVFNTALSDSELETITSWTSFTEMATGQLYKTY